MTSLAIPSQWLVPKQHPGKWIFQCSTDLPNLVKTHRAARYFRQLVVLLEDDSQIVDYHLELQHNFRRNNRLDVVIFFDNPIRTVNPSATSVCISCEPTHELSMTSLLSERQHTRAWLDARARPKLILTPIRHVERLSELIDENGEMEAFWQDAVELVAREAGDLERFYPNMVINHGTYRNHSHLHLKINFIKHLWNTIIAPQHQEALENIKKLLQNPTIVEDCLGENYSVKAKDQGTLSTTL
jgi:diadenosine tetraphosphate (Ap4A) HIT family hydrolase